MGETFERLAEKLVDKYLTPQIELETREKCIKLLMKNMNICEMPAGHICVRNL